MPKKVAKYVPATKYPRSSIGCRNIIRKAGYTPGQIIEFLRAENNLRTYKTFNRFVNSWDVGTLNEAGFANMHPSTLNRLCEHVFPQTKEFAEINEAFLSEFDKREDLQTIYRDSWSGRFHVYDLHGTFLNVADDSPIRMRPDNYMQFDAVVYGNGDSRQKIELSRVTPYCEGDLVKLRSTSVGNIDYDPLYTAYFRDNEYGGKGTPDASIERIGTVISVTEKMGNWRCSRGSKIIKVMWMPSGKMIDTEERHLKWHERPTKKNGMRS